MTNKITHRLFGIILMFLFLFTVAGCGTDTAAETESTPPETFVHTEANAVTLSDEEVMALATHILKARYTGTYVTEYGTKFLFTPTEVIKGELESADSAVIYVQPRSGELAEENPQASAVYTEGEQYLLFLEKNISVYYEHNIYVQTGDLQVSSQDSQWADYCAQAVSIAAETDDCVPDAYGNLYTDAEQLSDIAAFSSNIFVVTVDSVLAESSVQPTTAYRCTVTGTVKNTPAENGNIIITFFNDTVEVGGEYLVFLADATKTAPVYTLAARNGCVYSVESARSVSELNTFLNQVAEYAAASPVENDDGILEQEQNASSQGG